MGGVWERGNERSVGEGEWEECGRGGMGGVWERGMGGVWEREKRRKQEGGRLKIRCYHWRSPLTATSRSSARLTSATH